MLYFFVFCIIQLYSTKTLPRSLNLKNLLLAMILLFFYILAYNKYKNECDCFVIDGYFRNQFRKITRPQNRI